MFACRDAVHLMTEEREGALTGWERVKYRAHMGICVYCKRYRRQLDETLARTKEIPPEEVSAGVEEAAVAAFRARAGGK
jgi:hypothetical protein